MTRSPQESELSHERDGKLPLPVVEAEAPIDDARQTKVAAEASPRMRDGLMKPRTMAFAKRLLRAGFLVS
jgi:hypothetical protein